MFKYYGSVHIDWRLEFLSQALSKMLPLWDLMVKNFDMQKMSKGGGRATLDSKVLKEVKDALVLPNFKEFSTVLMMKGVAVERQAKWLEGCWCHTDVWKSRMSWSRKQRRIKAELGATTCVWKGCRGAEMAAGRAQALGVASVGILRLRSGFRTT